MIDRVYQAVKMLSNTEVRGVIKPSDFDKALYLVMMEKFEEYPFEIDKYTNRLNRGLINEGLGNLVDISLAKMDYYSTAEPMEYDAGFFKLPENILYLESIHYKINEVSLCKNAKEFLSLSAFKHTQPSVDYPIGTKINKTIKILPSAITSDVIIYYIRKPLIPKWTYVEFNGVEIFNPDATDFQDIDMHPSEEDDLITRLLIKFGINLKEQDLQVAGISEENKEESKKQTR